MLYQIQTIEIENQGRHRILLHGGVFSEFDAKAIRTVLARHLYTKMKQRPAFIFVYDRPEDLHAPHGFSVARLCLPIDATKYLVEVRDRSGLEMPTEYEFSIFDQWCKLDRETADGMDFDSASVDKCFAFLYQAPVIRFEITA